jgi:hypothetical protein
MITYNEMYQAQQRYFDLINETKAPRHNEVLGPRPGAAKRLMMQLKTLFVSKPSKTQQPAVHQPAGAH